MLQKLTVEIYKSSSSVDSRIAANANDSLNIWTNFMRTGVRIDRTHFTVCSTRDLQRKKRLNIRLNFQSEFK